MKVYIAGPMDGKPSYNFPAFNEAKRLWEGAGHSVTTPFDTNSRVWQAVTGTDFIPGITRCDYGDPILKRMFAEDLKVVCEVDAVVVLPGWQQSKGTRTELIVALLMGVPILCHDPKFSNDPMEFVDLRDILDGVKSIDFTAPRPEPGAVPAETILQEAQRVVHGDRGSSYGPPGDDYRCTGRIWGAMIDRWLHDKGFRLVCVDDLPTSFTDADAGVLARFPDIPTELGTLMMIAVKLSRQTHQHKRDNLTDIAGYAECVSMIHELPTVADVLARPVRLDPFVTKNGTRRTGPDAHAKVDLHNGYFRCNFCDGVNYFHSPRKHVCTHCGECRYEAPMFITGG